MRPPFIPSPTLIMLAIYLSFLLPLEAQQQFVQKGTNINGEASGDFSGSSVSMPDAHTIAIGAMNNDGNGNEAGHVRIFKWNGVNWLQKGSDIDGEAAGDEYGSSVSMPDSNTVAIGAPRNDGNGSSSGHVRVYQWNGSNWMQKGLDIDGEALGDAAGFSVSMADANTVAIGAPLNDSNGLNAGHVRVYKWSGLNWLQKGLDIDGEATGDYFGMVSMPDPNTVAIGAPNNTASGAYAGHVRIFKWNGTSWVQKGLDLDGESGHNWSGHAICMPDSNTVAIGAYGNDDNGSDAGHVRIFSWDGSKWKKKGNNINGELSYDKSGWSISMADANTIAIGAPNNTASGAYSGHVRIFKWNGIGWVQKGLDIDGEMSYNQSGWAVSMPDTNTVAVGAPFKNGADGHVRIFEMKESLGYDDELLDKKPSIQLFPNPTNGTLSISCPKNKPGKVRVLDLIGKEIVNSSLDETIQLPEHLNGVFIIEVELDGIIYRQKVLKY